MSSGCAKFAAGEVCTVGNHFQYERTQPWTNMWDGRQSRTPVYAAVVCTHAFTPTAYPSAVEDYYGADGLRHTRVLSNYGTGQYLEATSPVNVIDNVPRRYWTTYDGSGRASGIKHYNDGVAQVMTIVQDGPSGNGITTSTVTTDPFVLGNQRDVLSADYIDRIKNFRHWNVVKDAAFIASYGSPGNAPPAANLANVQLAINFADASGTTAVDSSVNGFNGAMSSPSLWDSFYPDGHSPSASRSSSPSASASTSPSGTPSASLSSSPSESPSTSPSGFATAITITARVVTVRN